LKRFKGGVMVESIKISTNILPFGHMELVFRSTEERTSKKEMPIYVEPRSTNIEKIEIFYERNLKEYKVSENTDGR